MTPRVSGNRAEVGTKAATRSLIHAQRFGRNAVMFARGGAWITARNYATTAAHFGRIALAEPIVKPALCSLCRGPLDLDRLTEALHGAHGACLQDDEDDYAGIDPGDAPRGRRPILRRGFGVRRG